MDVRRLLTALAAAALCAPLLATTTSAAAAPAPQVDCGDGSPVRQPLHVVAQASAFAQTKVGIMITTGRAPYDALAAGPLAAALNTPIFYTDGSGRHLAEGEYIAGRARGHNEDPSVPAVDTVLIIGGPSAVSPELERFMRDVEGFTVWRIAGDDRYQTAVEVGRALDAAVAEASCGRAVQLSPGR